MFYSVWKPDRQVYLYYEDSKGVSDDGPTPSKFNLSKLGNAPSEISWRLPIDAKSIGSGAKARGVVIHPESLGDFEMGGALPWVGLVIAAFLIYKTL